MLVPRRTKWLPCPKVQGWVPASAARRAVAGMEW